MTIEHGVYTVHEGHVADGFNMLVIHACVVKKEHNLSLSRHVHLQLFVKEELLNFEILLLLQT